MFLEMFIEDLRPYLKSTRFKCHYRGFILGLARGLVNFADAAGMAYGIKLIIQRDLSYEDMFKWVWLNGLFDETWNIFRYPSNTIKYNDCRISECIIAGSWSIGNALSLTPNFNKGVVAAQKVFNLLERIPAVRNTKCAVKKIWVRQTFFW